MATVYVPATSANVGAGFDVLGLALNLGNTVAMEEGEGCHITSLDGVELPAGPDNMVYDAARMLYKICGVPFPGLRLVQTSPIPPVRGLGSSSACIVAGLIGANALLKNPCSREDLLDIAAKLEGHPDNVAPALLGGLVASCIDGEKVYSVKKEISPTLEFAVFVPDYKLPTKKARGLLPQTVSHADAVFNLSRAPLCQAALCEGRLDLLAVACEDRLHQRFRLPHMPGGDEVFALAREAGAKAVFISGAGPAIIAVVERSQEDFWPQAQWRLAGEKQQGADAGRFVLWRHAADNAGARLI